MVRSLEELDDIFDEIRKKIILANRMDELDSLLIKWGITEEEPVETDRFKYGKIAVIGGSEVSESVLVGIGKTLGISKSRFEFCDYEGSQKFNYRKMLDNLEYSAVLFGAVPHSAKDKGDSSSIIVEIETRAGYPPVKRLISGNELKITKSNFRNALQEFLAMDTIRADISVG